MVDSVGGAGGPANISQVNRTSSARNNDREEVRSTDDLGGLTPTDEVQISDEAISLGAAEQTAREVREQLREDQAAVLSQGQQVDELL